MIQHVVKNSVDPVKREEWLQLVYLDEETQRISVHMCIFFSYWISVWMCIPICVSAYSLAYKKIHNSTDMKITTPYTSTNFILHIHSEYDDSIKKNICKYHCIKVKRRYHREFIQHVRCNQNKVLINKTSI